MVDHVAKLAIVLVDALISYDFFVVFNYFQRFHVEVVLERKMNVNFAGSYQQFFQLHILKLFVKD